MENQIYRKARRSRFGKETTFLWEATTPLNYEQLCLEEVPSTLFVSSQLEEEIKQLWEEECRKKGQGSFDGTKWRFEGYREVRGGLDLHVSSTKYSWHSILRNRKLPISEYPNPTSINALQVTMDGFIPIGVRGKISDQKGLCALGSGFIDREVDTNGNNYPPRSPFDVIVDECHGRGNKAGEAKYLIPNPQSAFDIRECIALGAIFGSNHDTTICMHVPLKCEKKYVDLGNQEHSDLLFLATDRDSLNNFLNEEGMQGIRAADHLLGDVELYMINKEKGALKSS